jgi:hypothetical protein
MTRSDQMGKRYTELMGVQGTTSKEAVKIVNAEFKTALSDITIRGYGAQYKKKVSKTGVRSEREDRNEDKTHGLRRSQEPAAPVQSPEQISLAEIDERIRAGAREVFQEMLHSMREEMNVIADTQDAPPEPHVIKGEGKGRRENRRYTKASVTVDKVLWNLFVKERDKLRVSTGRLMDIILWRHFGKPKLSYEKQDE